MTLRPPRSPLRSAREWDRWAREQDVADQAAVEQVTLTIENVAADLDDLDQRELAQAIMDKRLHRFLP